MNFVHSRSMFVMETINDRMRLKDKIVANVAKAIKTIQEAYVSSPSVTLGNDDWQCHHLCENLEHTLLHGLRHITPGYWKIVLEFTRKDCVKEIKRMTNVTTDLGRGRAWLFTALNECLLESYLRCYQDNEKIVEKYYMRDAIVRDPARFDELLMLITGLETIKFKFECDVPYLDLFVYPPKGSGLSSMEVRRDFDKLSDKIESIYVPPSRPLPQTKRSRKITAVVVTGNGNMSTDKDSMSLGSDDSTSHKHQPSIDGDIHSDWNYIQRSNTPVERLSISQGDDSLQSEKLEVIRVKKGKKEGKKKGKKVRSVDQYLPPSGTRLPGDGIQHHSDVLKMATENKCDITSQVNTPQNINKDSSLYNFSTVTSAKEHEHVADTSKTAKVKLKYDSGHVAKCNSPKHEHDTSTIVKNMFTKMITENVSDIVCEGEKLEKEEELWNEKMKDDHKSNSFAEFIKDSWDTKQNFLYLFNNESVHNDEVIKETDTVKKAPDISSIYNVDRDSFSDDDTSTEHTDRSLAVSINDRHSDNNGSSSGQILKPVGLQQGQDFSPITSNKDINDLEWDLVAQMTDETSARARSPSLNAGEVLLDNNTILQLVLDVLENDETSVKMFCCREGHTEGSTKAVFVLISSHSLYLLERNKNRFQKQAVIHFKEIDFVSTGFYDQILHIACKKKWQKFWLTPGDQRTTLAIVQCLKDTMEKCEDKPGSLAVDTGNTIQKISLQKYVAHECRCETTEGNVICYSLIHWEDPNCEDGPCEWDRKGTIYYKSNETTNILGTQTWRLAYAVLSDNILCLYHDKTATKPTYFLNLGGSECVGCKRDFNSDRNHAIKIMLSDNSHWSISLESDQEANSWLQGLCQAVSEGLKMSHSRSTVVPCCMVLSKQKVLMCHEELNMNFIRTLGSAKLEDITSLLYDRIDMSYLVLVFDSEDLKVTSEKWILYFNTDYECNRFKAALTECWYSLYQVEVPILILDDFSLQRKCNEVSQHLKYQMSYS